MTGLRVESVVAVAFAHTAEVQAWRLTTTGEEREHIVRTLRNLSGLGHIVGFSVSHAGSATAAEFTEQLRSRIGGMMLDACRGVLETGSGPPPAFLMPVWDFDHSIRGMPAATGRLLGLDLELLATPSCDEEFGARLPGRDGLWLIHAYPMF